MWPFRKKGEVESKIDKLDYTLENSFQRVRQDMDSVNTWISYLYSKDIERQKLIEIIYQQMSHISSPQEYRSEAPSLEHFNRFNERVISVERKLDTMGVSVRAMEPIIDRVAQLNSQVKLVEESQKSVFERLRDFSAKIDRQEMMKPAAVRTVSNLRDKIVRNVARRSKDYIKGLILSTISKYEQVSALQLREMFVEEQGLCSKSTFYRILEEIETEDGVSMIAKGKEKVYIPKLMKKH